MDILRKKVDKFPIEDYFPEFSAYRPPPLDNSGREREGERERK